MSRQAMQPGKVRRWWRAGGCLWLGLLAVERPVGAALWGEARRLDGSSCRGEVRLEQGAFLFMATPQETARVRPEQLGSLRCERVPDQMPTSEQGQGRGLEGTYFENLDFTGKTFQRLDEVIDFSWGSESPHAGLGRDNFSVRWQGKLEAPSTGKYTFYIVTDDGGRLWLEDRLLVEQWRDQSPVEGRAEAELEAGRKYRLKMEYYEHSGEAVARLLWSGPSREKEVIPGEFLYDAQESPPENPNRGLLGSYYTGTSLEGLALARRDAVIDFDWGGGSPRRGIPKDKFSIRWLGQVTAARTDTYTFELEADDGVRLWLGDRLVADAWREGARQVSSPPIALREGQPCRLRLEYFERGGAAKIRLLWSSPSMARTVVPSEVLTPALPQEALLVQPPARRLSAPPGVLLTSGTFIARPVHAADAASVRFSENARDPVFSVVAVAQLFLQSVPWETVEKLDPGRTGLLLENGDFIDGEFKSFAHGRVHLSSVLFGLRSFERHRVRAIVLRPVRSGPAVFEVRSRDGSVFRVDGFAVGPNGLSFPGPQLAGVVVASADLAEVSRSPGGTESNPPAAHASSR